MGPDIANFKTQKCHETGQIDFQWLKVYVLVASKLRFFPLTPNSVLPNSLKPYQLTVVTWVCTNEKYVTCLRKMLPCPVFQDLFWFMVKSQHEWQSKYVVQSHRMLLQYFLSLFDLWLRHLNLINQKVSLPITLSRYIYEKCYSECSYLFKYENV